MKNLHASYLLENFNLGFNENVHLVLESFQSMALDFRHMIVVYEFS